MSGHPHSGTYDVLCSLGLTRGWAAEAEGTHSLSIPIPTEVSRS